LEKPFTIFPLGDSAATIDLENRISEELNRKVLSMERWVTENPFEGIKDLIVAYSSLTVFYDAEQVKKKYHLETPVYEFVREKLAQAWSQSVPLAEPENSGIIHFPLCYAPEFGTDLEYISNRNGLSAEEIVQLHSSRTYRVYMIGFLPGFSYLGQVDDRLVTPRKIQPAPVTAGSVGIAGSQTGIYSLQCPGGWQIIGRTPVRLFDANADAPVRLKAGDRVKFYPVSRAEYDQWISGAISFEWDREY
jgi:inhibitor of KinA